MVVFATPVVHGAVKFKTAIFFASIAIQRKVWSRRKAGLIGSTSAHGYELSALDLRDRLRESFDDPHYFH
jgi:hypothetical protein